MSKPITLSAMQTNNRITLGNYLGALRHWVKVQDQYDCYFFAVDLHAITTPVDPKLLKDLTYQGLAIYLAAGLDPKHCKLFVQSHVSEHAELSWVLTCFASMGELSRMTQYKEKAAKAGAHIPAGIFAYPVLMAADILLYDTNFVPVGDDQKQHIELTRDLAIRMNGQFGADTFVVPEPMIAKVGARIMSLQDPNSKMSKSDPDPHATVFLMDSDKEIEKKFKRAVTDSGSVITDSPEQAGVHNLLTIQSCISGKPIKELVTGYAGKQYGHLKVETAEQVIATVKPIRDEAQRMLADKSYLDGILKQSAEKARAHAARTLERVYDRVGFIPRT